MGPRNVTAESERRRAEQRYLDAHEAATAPMEIGPADWDKANTIRIGSGEMPEVECEWFVPPHMGKRGCLQEPVVAVAMASPPERVGSILIPDSDYAAGTNTGMMRERNRSDMGRVVANSYKGLAPGIDVLVMPFAGKWMSGFTNQAKGIRYGGQVRYYGRVMKDGVIEAVDVSDGIPAMVVKQNETMSRIVPLGDKYLLLRPKIETERNGVFVPRQFQTRDGSAIVLERGDRARLASPGNRVLYMIGGDPWGRARAGVVNIEWAADAELAAQVCAAYGIEADRLKDLCIVTERCLLGVLE